MTATTSDHKKPQLSKKNQVIRDQQQLLAYVDEKMLNLTSQFRGLLILLRKAKITINGKVIDGKDFFEAFVDDEYQDQVFQEIHAAEDAYNKKITQGAQPSLGDIAAFKPLEKE